MTFRELELIAFLSGSFVHGSQAVLIARYLRRRSAIERTEAWKGLVSVGQLFVWQFSNFACVLFAALGFGYPSLPSKLGNLVRWGSMYTTPVMLSYVVTDLRLYGHPAHPRLVKVVAALRRLLWAWLLVAVVSLIGEGTQRFLPIVPFRHASWITLSLMLALFVVMTIQGVSLRREMGPSPLGRTRRAGLIASGAAAVLILLSLAGGLAAFVRLAPFFGLASMMTTVPFSIYLAYRYCQFPFMDVYTREAVTGLVLAFGFTAFVAVSPLLPLGLQVPWLVAAALSLAFVKAPVAREAERRLLGYREAVEEQEERIGNNLRSLTNSESFAEQAGDILRVELEAKWVAIGTEVRPGAVQHYPLKGSSPGWFALGPRVGDRAYMSRQLRLARSAALQVAAQLEWLRGRDSEHRRLVEQHELREVTARAEVRALQAQINPHFLFNALNALANLIQESPDRAERVTEQLAEVFCYALESTRRERVSLDEEVRFLQAYLDIEQARFGERLRHHWSLDPEAAKIQIAPMLLQPLVENAVRHGIAPSLQGGDVWVSAWLTGKELVFQVEDSGVGIAADSSKSGFGVGLNNVRERLLRCYGGSATLLLEPRKPQGTRATLSLPLEAGWVARRLSRQEVSP
jgi:signal transduction histidine kinase